MSSTPLTKPTGMSTPAKPVAVPADVSHRSAYGSFMSTSVGSSIYSSSHQCRASGLSAASASEATGTTPTSFFAWLSSSPASPAVSSFPMSSPASTSSPRVRQFNDGPFSGGFRSNVYYH
ncbi:expressed protein [Batrachochytrium dendrobatidis JAM81]|uniref:Expressed protein n=1 Tax=Batrachochytrium dendrobatidis (strain JAM81 / FGSC 10211) TaxID=684364 RepID=F4P370_BATDJ|nr:uncharacterized protein BATDEDRAFT_36950 [Batrachochytrium dendrobatidis JAM81]EGF80093.1 expressed protein [Batrachochytrium dendrobatidis JAM81]|eukprot:XP_006679134.1 expressed protein [Batrachochytrium dendrobatidis JAM81]